MILKHQDAIKTIRDDRPVVLVGNPQSLFIRSLASYWAAQGLNAVIVTRKFWNGEPILPDGTTIILSEQQETENMLDYLHFLSSLVSPIEEEIFKRDEECYRKAMADWGENRYRPSIVPAIIDGMSIAHTVMSLNPRFVFGQEAFSYGLATALCRGIPRLLMPWGGDIYMFAETSPLAFAVVKYALHKVDMVIPTSVTAGHHLCERFGLPINKVTPLSWGVDVDAFRRADSYRRLQICEKFRINPSSVICLNVRRFRPGWGSERAMQAFMRMSEINDKCHFVMLGGAGTEEHIERARQMLSSKNLSHRFTILDGDIPLSTCAELMSVSDIFVSLMRMRDMRSFSILQATASGAAPILSDQKEYREMERLGFQAQFVNPDDIEEVVTAINAYINDRKFLEYVVQKNHIYLSEHENYHHQMNKMLKVAEAVIQSYDVSGGVYQAADYNGSAIQLIEDIILKNPDISDLHNIYGELLIHSGEDTRAKAVLENLLKSLPENLHALNNLAVIEIKSKNFRKALDFLKRILVTNPDNKAAHKNMQYLRQQVEASHATVIKT